MAFERGNVSGRASFVTRRLGENSRELRLADSRRTPAKIMPVPEGRFNTPLGSKGRRGLKSEDFRRGPTGTDLGWGQRVTRSWIVLQ